MKLEKEIEPRVVKLSKWWNLKNEIEPRVVKLFLMMKPENRNRAQSSKTVLNHQIW